MAMTTRQQQVAQAPWQSTPQELIDVMNALCEMENLAAFGNLGSPVVLDIQKAALTRNIPIPSGFQSVIKRIDATGSSGWNRKQVPYIPNGTV